MRGDKRKRLDSYDDTVSQVFSIGDESRKVSRLIVGLSALTIVGVMVSLFYFFTSDLPDTLYLAKMSRVNAQVQDEHESDDPGLTVATVPGVILQVDRETAMAYLEKMDNATIDGLLGKVIGGNSTTGVKNVDDSSKSLEAAYAEAEEKYPGQINASKRLQLINELNAKDYMYYVAENGDTLLALSAAFSVPLGQLVEINGIQDADVIPAGMIILFPSETAPKTETVSP